MQFAVATVTTDATRFKHALSDLDEDTIGLVAGALEDGSYNRLKELFIRRLSVSEEAKLYHLLNELTLDDRTPKPATSQREAARGR